MAKYDDASWHYGGDYPKDLPNENAATHIGMFLAWCIDNDLMSEELTEDVEEEIKQVKNRELSGADFLIDICDESFGEYDLNELGNDFAKAYYEYTEPTKFTEKYASYIDDYARLLNNSSTENDIYKVENSWQNYDLLKPIIEQRFKQWQDFIAKK